MDQEQRQPATNPKVLRHSGLVPCMWHCWQSLLSLCICTYLKKLLDKLCNFHLMHKKFLLQAGRVPSDYTMAPALRELLSGRQQQEAAAPAAVAVTFSAAGSTPAGTAVATSAATAPSATVTAPALPADVAIAAAPSPVKAPAAAAAKAAEAPGAPARLEVEVAPAKKGSNKSRAASNTQKVRKVWACYVLSMASRPAIL